MKYEITTDNLYKVEGEGNPLSKEQFDAKYAICPNCDNVYLKENMNFCESDKKYYCEDCTHEMLVVCEDCGQWFFDDDIIYVSDDESYHCKSCIDSSYEYARCYQCDEYHLASRMVFTADSDHYYCDFCQDDLYRCDDCGDWFAYDDSGSWDDDGDSWYCDSCFEHNRGPIDSYHTMKRNNDYIFEKMDNEDKPLYLGYELEIDDGDNAGDCARELKDEFGSFFHYEYDGSLNSGFEIISQPASLRYHLEKINFEALRTIVRNYGFTSHQAKTCGLHIHMDKAYFGDGKALDCAIAKLLFLFERHWDNLVRFSRRTDIKLNWCDKYNRSPSSVIDDMKKNGLNRYHAVNLTNRNTIEIRMWRGTLNPLTFRAALKLTERLAELAKSTPAVKLNKMAFEEILGDDPDIKEYWAIRNPVTTETESEATEPSNT